MVDVPSTNSVTLALHDLGGAGPPLLWSHATGFHGRVYGPVSRHVPGRRHWAVDFRGFGDSSEPDEPIHWRGFGDDVLAVVDALDDPPRQAVGHSMGGAALLLAEMQRPGTFDRLWLFEPIVFPAGPATGENPLAVMTRRRRQEFVSFEAAIERYSSGGNLSTLHPDSLDAYVRHGFRAVADGGIRLKCDREFEAAVYDTARDAGAFERLAEVRCEVVVASSGDADGPAAIAPMVADALPAGRHRRFPDHGHFGPIDDPTTMGRAISGDLDA